MELNNSLFEEKNYTSKIYDFLTSLPILVEIKTEDEKKALLKDDFVNYNVFYNISNDSVFIVNKESGVIAKKVTGIGWVSINNIDNIIIFLKALKMQSDLLDGSLIYNVITEKEAEKKNKHNIL